MAHKRKCSNCGKIGHDRRLCKEPIKKKIKKFDPWKELEWDEHMEAQELCRAHPDGMTLEEVGSAMGITRERVRQIEIAAIAKLKSPEIIGYYIKSDNFNIQLTECTKCSNFFVRDGTDVICDDCKPPIFPEHIPLKSPEYNTPEILAYSKSSRKK